MVKGQIKLSVRNIIGGVALLAVMVGQADAAEIHLKYFNMQKGMPNLVADSVEALFTRPNSSQSYLVQFKAPLKASDHKSLKEMGVKSYSYVPDNAFVMVAEEAVIDSLAKSELVQSVEPMQPYYRLQGEILEALNNQKMSIDDSAKGYNVVAVSKSQRKALAEKIQSIGGDTSAVNVDSVYFGASLTQDQVMQVASWDEVLWVDLETEGGFDMDNALLQGGAVALRNKTNMSFRGRGVRGHVLEGINAEHPDFAETEHRKAPVAIGESASSSHGQATYGQVFGSGEGNPKAQGVLPDAQGFYTNYDHVFNKPGERLALTKQLIDEHKVMFQTASWGNGRTTEYTSISAEMDNIIFQLDIPITQSQSNSGSRWSRPQAWAKNVISVGGLRHNDNADPSDDRWGGASIGPATDGRIKPDISAYYDDIETTSLEGYTTSFGGTSGATPIVAGYVGLLIEVWTSGLLGNVLPLKAKQENIFANRPHFSTVKAMLINSARQYQFSGADHNRTRVHQGWGFPSVSNLIDTKDSIKLINEDDVLTTGDQKSYEFDVADGHEQLKVTMVYAEPAGNPAAEKQLINDLDLKVTSPSGKTYLGNVGLLANMFSTEGGEPDNKDPVENVFIENPEAGKWKITVLGRSINVDAHLETADVVDADYALVISSGQK